MESSWSNIANRRPEASMSNLFMVLLAIASFYIVQFIVKLRAVRKRYKDWPGLPHDPIWGHLKSIGTYVRDDGYFCKFQGPKLCGIY